eukprot:4201673-Ditylum_brightwellii.AAC.1
MLAIGQSQIMQQTSMFFSDVIVQIGTGEVIIDNGAEIVSNGKAINDQGSTIGWEEQWDGVWTWIMTGKHVVGSIRANLKV